MKMEEVETLEAWFVAEKETKNTIRYREDAESHPLIGVIYVQKAALALLGNPQRIKVTIESGREELNDGAGR